jgi:GNAT superfamily N-acetyltransferase
VTIELRVITPGDWEALRTIRLRALEGSPDSFGATLSGATALSPDEWRGRAAGAGPVVLAFADERPVAMGGLYMPPASAEAIVWGMWVEPAARGGGVAARILERLLDHPDAEGRSVLLHVAEGNDTARRLYERHGFTEDGETQPLRDGSEVRIRTMRRA